uniref:Uncharacterized protein n=1 Tax=Avena sativa TaxID=4498 RepID=A0ACD5VVL4_AVESA
MERLERKEAAQIRVEVILRDGSTAAAYRLAPPWEHCGDSTGGGAAAASTETTASLAAPAVPAQAALMVARLVLTIVSAGNTSSISLVPRGQDGEAGEAHGSSSMSIQIYPTENRAVMRVFDIAGYQKKWCSTGLYTMCVEHSFHAVSSELVFGKDARVFDVTRCEEFQFPPFKLNFAMDFNVLKKLGDGTEGKVSRCSCKFTEYRCAIKEVIPSNLMITSTSSEPSDVSILADLSHPNKVKLHLAWNEKGRDYFGCPADITFRSMKLCARTLSTYLKRTSKFELATANHIFRQIVMGLEHAHAHYVVHHDLKPANILMDDDLTIKICDFGTAERKKISKLKT